MRFLDEEHRHLTLSNQNESGQNDFAGQVSHVCAIASSDNQPFTPPLPPKPALCAPLEII